MKRTALVLTAACLTLAGCGGGSEEADASSEGSTAAASTTASVSAADRETAAYESCIDAATDLLKAPATAQFAEEADVDISQFGLNYTVVGAVDSENSFGALIRNTYTCQVYIDSDGTAAGTADVTFLGH